MRNLLVSLIALGAVAGTARPADAQTAVVVVGPAAVQSVQYYEPGWRERAEWRHRREVEFRRREEWRRRQEWREQHAPLPYYGYGPRY